MEKVIEDANRSGWNHLLPCCLKIIQKSEVAEQILKASRNVLDRLGNNFDGAAKQLTIV